jgi:hypothetical protein
MSFRLPLGLTQAIRLTILPRAHQAPQARFFTSTLPAFKPTPSPSSTPSLLRISIATATPLQASRPQCTPKNPFSLLRSFHTTRHNLMRPNYFPRNSGSGRKSSGSSGGPGFFRRMLISIENLPHTYIVCLLTYLLMHVLTIDLRTFRFEYRNLFPLGICQNFISTIQRSFPVSIHGQEFLD